MSLQLSKSKPRQLQYAAGGLREEFTLLELEESLLDTILQDQVVIKGEPDDDAVLCTRDTTYALKVVETTNTLLLVPPQESPDEDFAAIPSLSPGSDVGLRDVGLQTQLLKNSVSKQYPPLTATATAKSHVELVEIAPKLDDLPKLLGERPYSLEDEDEEAAAAAAVGDAMDADGPGAGGSRGCYTTQQLLQRVQASHSELLAELKRLDAVHLSGVWRLVDQTYLGQLLEMIIVSAMEHGWSTDAVPLQEAIEAVQSTGYIPAITKHCLEVFGSPCQQQTADSQAPAAAAGSGSSSSGSSHYALDERRVCLHYARKLLSEKDVWYRDAFLAAWHQVVPSCWCPKEEMLLGEAVYIHPEAHEGYSEPRLRHLPARHLPSSPGPRFAALFAVQPKWTRQQLDPYLAGIKVPGQTVDMLLLKYARASQRSPTDSTVVFVAR